MNTNCVSTGQVQGMMPVVYDTCCEDKKDNKAPEHGNLFDVIKNFESDMNSVDLDMIMAHLRLHEAAGEKKVFGEEMIVSILADLIEEYKIPNDKILSFAMRFISRKAKENDEGVS